MKIHYCRDYASMSKAAATSVIDYLTEKADAVVCAASGSSPTGLYRQLARHSNESPELFQKMRVVKLDEWLDVPANADGSCEHYLRNELLEPLKISAERYVSFSPNAPDAVAECRRIQEELDDCGGLDLCILGLGRNGHVGLNEPGATLELACHVAQLSEQTRGYGILQHSRFTPSQGLTLGMGDILCSRKILLLIAGQEKNAAIKSFFSRKLTTSVPAALLHLHDDVEVFVDENCCGPVSRSMGGAAEGLLQ